MCLELWKFRGHVETYNLYIHLHGFYSSHHADHHITGNTIIQGLENKAEVTSFSIVYDLSIVLFSKKILDTALIHLVHHTWPNFHSLQSLISVTSLQTLGNFNNSSISKFIFPRTQDFMFPFAPFSKSCQSLYFALKLTLVLLSFEHFPPWKGEMNVDQSRKMNLRATCQQKTLSNP